MISLPRAFELILTLLLLGSTHAQTTSAYYEPRPASWLGGEPFWDDTPSNYSRFYPITYVIFGFDGEPEVRSIVDENADCPTAYSRSSSNGDDNDDGITEFGASDGANYISPRANGKLVNNGKLPYVFPVQVCSIGADTNSAFRNALDTGDVVISYQNKTYDQIPRVKKNPKRFLLTGDTGLRSKPDNLGLGKLKDYPCNASEVYGIDQCYLNFTQEDINEPATGSFQGTDEWFFKDLADDAATREIDCIVYVGDYLYRQGPCPANATDKSSGATRNCSGINYPSVTNARELLNDEIINFLPGNFGDNWWGWWSDFFWPAMKLLQGSPIIPTRGNHEICTRGGYGYFFFMSPHALCPDCVDDLDNFCLESAQPYAVSFEHEQFLVMDDALINPLNGGIDDFIFTPGTCPGVPENGERIVLIQEPRTDDEVAVDVSLYTEYMSMMESMSNDYDTNFYVGHRPVFGIGCNGTKMQIMDWTLQQALGKNTLNRVSAMIAGHMHWFEVVKFQDESLPSQLVVGHGGTQLIQNFVDQDVWQYLRAEVGIEGDDIAGDVEWGLSRSDFGYAIMERNDDTLDYEVSFYFRNNETGAIELLEGTSLMIPKGPRIQNEVSGGNNDADNTGSENVQSETEDAGDSSVPADGGATANSGGGTDDGSPAPAPTSGAGATHHLVWWCTVHALLVPVVLLCSLL